jgi:hypothetical protein
MEHLASRAGSRPLKIPYLGGEQFEASMGMIGNIYGVQYYYKSYWDRKGWPRHHITGVLSFIHLRPRETAQALQTWLYFGTMISIFRVLGMPVQTVDFVVEERDGIFVRTSRLLDLVSRWTQVEGFEENVGRAQDIKDPRDQRGMCIQEMLNWTFFYLGMFGQQREAMTEPDDKACMHLVELSIMAMGESLYSVLTAVYGFHASEMPSWGPSPVLAARLQSNGWCISDSPFFPESMARAAVAADYYFSSFPCPRPDRAGGRHSHCTTAICNAYCQKIDSGDYKQRHVVEGCACKAEAVPQKAIQLVGQGRIPVLRWDGVEIHVSAGDGALSDEYIAISHVYV